MDSVLVRYNEIFLKSEYVRRRFEDRLLENISYAARPHGLDYKVKKFRGRLVLKAAAPGDLASVVANVFGVASTSPAIESSLGDVVDAAVKYVGGVLKKEDSFAVRVKRSGVHDFTSQELEAEVGAGIQEALGNSVNLTKPDKTVYAEVRDQQAFLYSDVIEGVGGLPYGTQGCLLTLVRDSNSLVAAWLMMRRGCSVTVLLCNASPELEAGVAKLGSYGRLKAIEDYCSENVFETAVECAHREKALGIVSGETLDEAEGVLHELDSLETSLPVYLPLTGLKPDGVEEIRSRYL